MKFKPLNKPYGLEDIDEQLQRFVRQLPDLIAYHQAFQITIDPASVPANSTSEQTFTVTGLTLQDIVTVNKPSHTSGFGIGGCRVSSSNTLAITFFNVTGLSINAPSEIYLVKSMRY